MGWREDFERIDKLSQLTHRGKFEAEQQRMRYLLDQYEQRLRQPWRELARHITGRKA